MAFECRAGVFRLWVGCSHIHYPGEWALSWIPIWNDPRPIQGATDADSAKRLAVEFVLGELQRAMDELPAPPEEGVGK